MIDLRNIEKAYRTKAGFSYVLRQISLEIGEGEFVTIMGPSGAGKSTLLGILGMYDQNWEGEFYLSETRFISWRKRSARSSTKALLVSFFSNFICSTI